MERSGSERLDAQGSSLSSGFWRGVLFVLAACGVPAVSGPLWWDWAMQHVLLAIGLLVAYGVLVTLVEILGQVWRRQQKKLVEAVNRQINWYVSGYFKQYRFWLRLFRQVDFQFFRLRS